MKLDYVTVSSAAALGVALVLLATPILSHHSTAMFVRDNPITIEGTLTEVAWANPHSLFFLDAKPVDEPGATVRNWSVETPSSRQLVAMGWEKETIKIGAKVKVRGFWRKDKRPQLLFIEVNDDAGHHFTTERAEYER
jgi:hypothetical protein